MTTMPRSVAWSVRTIAVAAAAAASYWLCVLPYRCNREILNIRTASEAFRVLSPIRAAEIARQNAKRLLDLCRVCRTNPTIYLALAANADAAGLDDEVIHDLDLALAAQPRPEVFADRARMKLGLGRFDEAIADFVVTAHFDPSYLDTTEPDLRHRVLEAAGLPRTTP
jgi:hypothetical protein